MIIKVKYLRSGQPHGRAYSFRSPVDDIKVGDIAQISLGSLGVVTEVGIKEEDLGFDPSKLKTILGKHEEV